MSCREEQVQLIADRFYTQHGPCCAGCDWWASFNSAVGECRRSAPVPGEQRTAMMRLKFISAPIEAGHVITPREHHCGDFKDDFDWSSLPAHYLRQIGRLDRPRQS